MIETLGGFRVRRGEQVVPPSAWRSKKAQSLLKILVSRSGQPVPRDVLKEALWPDADPATLANRLSVALSTVRTILDPERRFPADHFISAERDAVQIVLDHVAIDVEMFLHDVSAAEALRAAGRHTEAAEHLRAAVAAYTGDFLEEDLYEDWAIPLRERARAAYIAAARALAADAEAAGDRETRDPLLPAHPRARPAPRGRPPAAGAGTGRRRPPRRRPAQIPPVLRPDARDRRRARPLPRAPRPPARLRRFEGSPG